MRVEVALPVPVRHAFTYAVPEHLREGIEAGALVRVPFGPRTLVGVVLGPASDSTPDREVKELRELIASGPAAVPGPILELARWLADYYLAPPGEALRTVLPPGSLDPRESGRARPLRDSGHSLSAAVSGAFVRLTARGEAETRIPEPAHR